MNSLNSLLFGLLVLNIRSPPPPTFPSAHASQGRFVPVAADAGAGGAGMLRLALRGDMPLFFQNRLSGFSDEQGFITSASLSLSLTPPPDTRAATAFSHS